jgi:hypothetical protein
MRKTVYRRSDSREFYLVAVLQLDGKAHVALFAVEKLVGAPDPAYPAAGTMELVFVLVIEQVALQTCVLNRN